MPSTRNKVSKRQHVPAANKLISPPKKPRGRTKSAVQDGGQDDGGECCSSRPADRRDTSSGSSNSGTPPAGAKAKIRRASLHDTVLESIQQQLTTLADGINARMDNIEKEVRVGRRSRSTTPRRCTRRDSPRAVGDAVAATTPHRRRSRAPSRYRSPSSPPRAARYYDYKRRSVRRYDDRRYASDWEAIPRHRMHDEYDSRRAMWRAGPYTLINDSPDSIVRDPDRDREVNELLVPAGSAIGRKPGKSIIAPHKYVIRGNKNEKIEMEEAMWQEYIAALCRMTKDRRLPPWLDGPVCDQRCAKGCVCYRDSARRPQETR